MSVRIFVGSALESTPHTTESRERSTMHEALHQNLFLIKEHVGMFKAANNYDVYDPETGDMILHCREPHLGGITKMLRFTDYKRMTPFDIRVTTPEGEPVLSIERGISLFLSSVDVQDEDGDRVGGFKQKMFSIGGSFNVLGAEGQQLCTLKGKWTGWNFKFINDGVEFASVSKKWSGMGKEFFTSADNYILQISEDVPYDNPIRILILAAVFCIDMVLKEA
ncbi:phospholipid scramblase family protein [Planctomicrobium sp.]|nr:phospholipid scramblase-related protein [Planctomicrobium sp.]MDB4732940.1 phospholipid scramblase family protein [Planctomicrobium sp.]